MLDLTEGYGEIKGEASRFPAFMKRVYTGIAAPRFNAGKDVSFSSGPGVVLTAGEPFDVSDVTSRSVALMPLVYDIGLHDGGDTGHYLREGCRVVAIDANPIMCAAAQAKFRDYIRTGQLTVINCGVTEHKGDLQFWVCDDASEWSSFRLDMASRKGSKHHAVTVESVPINDIVNECGVPDYMKIDIEGYDRICIGGLRSATSPKYISIEMDHIQGNRDIQRLYDLGYRGFKVICQSNAWHQATIENIWVYIQLAEKHFVPRCWSSAKRSISRCFYGRRFGESGPWGEKTSGAWHSVDHAQSVWSILHEIEIRLGIDGFGNWYDIHAKK
jgi:FkbM family methyltransferase